MITRRSIVLFAVVISGIAIFCWLRAQRAHPVSVPILMYHRIGDEVDSPWWVTVKDFETQLQSLREQGYTSVWPSDLVAHQRWGWPLPRKPVLLTFDDGYLNLVEQAEPLLQKYGFKAVSFLITGRIGDTAEMRQNWEGTPLLIWPEVRAAQQRGTIRFGGHSRTHANLRALKDARQELASCYRDITRKGRFTPEGFCFPFGQYKDETLVELADAKFTLATTCKDGVAELKAGSSLLELPRVSVMGGWHRFRLRPQQGVTSVPGVEVSLEGRDLVVTPKVEWADGSFHWLPPIHVTSVSQVISCASPDGRTLPVVSVELWDDFHVICYLKYSMKSPELK